MKPHSEVLILISGNWRSAAACRSAEPDLFFPISASGKALEQVAEAKAICARCPVRSQCLAFSLRTRQPHGIWGGMTEEERAFIRQQGAADLATASAGRRGERTQPCSTQR